MSARSFNRVPQAGQSNQMKTLWSLIFLLSIVGLPASLIALFFKRVRKEAAIAALATLVIAALSGLIVSREGIAARTFSEEQADTIRRTARPIGYEQLARQPDLYAGNPVYVEGKVVSVTERGQSTDFGIEMAKNAESPLRGLIFVIYRRPTPETARILEGDTVRLSGEFRGLVSYKTPQGQSTRVPQVAAASIERIVVQ